MNKPNIKVVKSEEAPESTELLAKSIVQVSDAATKLLTAGLTKRAIVVLLLDGIGSSKTSKKQIELVLDNLPRLKSWYVR